MILITGASGLLGRELVRQFSLQGDVFGISKSGADGTKARDLSNLLEVKELFESNSFSAVVHTAAYSDVDGCERNPEMAYQANALAVKYIAECCLSKNIPLIHISTDYVFSGKKGTPYLETDATCPVNIYGLTKLLGEFYAASASVCLVLRTSWMFGEAPGRNFVKEVITNLKEKPEVGVLADQQDRPTYTKDLSLVVIEALHYLSIFMKKNPEKKLFEIYHACNQGETTRYQMALEIKEMLGLKKVCVNKAENKSIGGRLAKRPSYAVMCTDRYETVFKTRLRPWQEALKEYLSGANPCAF